jgi:hypothetical protein
MSEFDSRGGAAGRDHHRCHRVLRSLRRRGGTLERGHWCNCGQSCGSVAPTGGTLWDAGKVHAGPRPDHLVGLDFPLMALGMQADGTLQVPAGGFPAGWYTGVPTPGHLGPAIIAGHVDMKGPGVFYKLHDVVPGDQITVTRTDGSRPVFRVTGVKQFGKNKFPTNLVYGNIDHAGLRLITCGGSFNSATGHYEDNLVVFADLLTVPQ